MFIRNGIYLILNNIGALFVFLLFLLLLVFLFQGCINFGQSFLNLIFAKTLFLVHDFIQNKVFRQSICSNYSKMPKLQYACQF